ENGYLYEGTGLYEGKSSLRKVAYQKGEPVQRINLEDRFFGEGITIMGDRIILLTYREKVGVFYNKHIFAKKGECAYGMSTEGWGLCYDGNRLIKSDGSSRLYFLNKETFAEEGFIEVYNHEGPVDSINELEWIGGKIYANVYQKDIIIIIDPASGAV